MLECVVNISEGRDATVIDAIAAAAGDAVLDVHSDPHHHRSVLTLVGEDAPRAVASQAVERLDIRRHQGVHPRLGVVDVVPFVALGETSDAEALGARDRFAEWLSSTHDVPCFLYGPDRSLPEVRRSAFEALEPDTGPISPHPSAGATAVGARPLLVAYNLWLDAPDVQAARRIAAAARGPQLRALGLAVGERLQVSMNLVDPAALGPAGAFDLVSRLAESADARVTGAELVGLVPLDVLAAVPRRRWEQLDLGEDRTIEARLAAAGGLAG